jgi:hypothetical protein
MRYLVLLAALAACPLPKPVAPDAAPVPVADAAPTVPTAPDAAPALMSAPPLASLPPAPAAAAVGKSTATLSNGTSHPVVVYFAFGADSVVLPAAWPFCENPSHLTCQAQMKANSTLELPLNGQYLNLTFAFGSPVSCGTTKGELNLNNPKWYDVADVSLVDGYSNKILITDGTTKIGPPVGAAGNEKVFGLYPLGCDICTARQHPPCGMKPGSDGCKSGTQYKPDVPCQWQGTVMGGGSHMVASLMP